MAIKKPVGILHVNVVRAIKLLKMDLLGTSDPYVKLSLTGDKLPAKKTTIKRKNLNPQWNEKFKLVVKDPQSQVLQLQVYDWDKVGGHDKLGMQLVPLKLLKPYENKEFTLDLLKDTNINETPNKKPRGKIVVDLTFVPFKEDSMKFVGSSEGGYVRKESGIDVVSDDEVQEGAGLLSVVIQEADEVEGHHHNNPFAILTFRGEKKRTKVTFSLQYNYTSVFSCLSCTLCCNCIYKVIKPGPIIDLLKALGQWAIGRTDGSLVEPHDRSL